MKKSRALIQKITNPFIVVLIVAVFSLLAMKIYSHGALQGNFNQYFLPAKIFGIPSELEKHGITELYTDNVNFGWDGQFYYYIANDPWIHKDTAKHIDSNAYRYQRIGLPLVANIASKVTLQSWVSPLTYYLTNLLIILMGTGMAAFYFKRKGLSPYWALCWALGLGTQITLLNGLPDGAADGFFITAVVAFLLRWRWVYLGAMTLAALSREIYVLIPCFVIASICLQNLKIEGFKHFLSLKSMQHMLSKSWIHVIPIVIWLAWRIFIQQKFGVSPSSQAYGVLGWPLLNTWQHLLNDTTKESWAIMLYLVLLAMTVFYLSKSLYNSKPRLVYDEHEFREFYFGFALAFLFIIATYLCFGPTVMSYHTGYFKAANIFLFVIPFIIVSQNKKFSIFVKVLLIVIVVYFGTLLWSTIKQGPLVPVHLTKIENK